MDMGFSITQFHGGMNPAFSALTHVSGGTVVQALPQYVEVTNVTTGLPVIVNVFFDERCGWAFDRWEITDINGNVETVRQNPYRLMKYGNEAYAFLAWGIEAFGTYAGTGKIMVSYNDHSKVIRTADAPVKIFIDL